MTDIIPEPISAQKDIAPAKDFARRFGVKAVVYGGPGMAKTPLLATTSPYPLLLATEPGLTSLRKSDVPTIEAYTVPRIEGFFNWLLGSDERKKYHTLIIDSTSQHMEALVDFELSFKSKSGAKRDGQAAYGDAARHLMKRANELYFLQQMNVVLIAKLQKFEENNVIINRPYWPGKEVNVRLPHLYDEILCLGDFDVPGAPVGPNGKTKAFLCRNRFDYVARDRSGELNEYEAPNMGNLIKKCMQ